MNIVVKINAYEHINPMNQEWFSLHHLLDRLVVEGCFCIAPYFVDEVSPTGVAGVAVADETALAAEAASLSAFFALASSSYSSSSSTLLHVEAPRAGI